MLKIPKLALFDVDGTIAKHEIISSEILKGFNDLHSHGCITSLTTGRNYTRLKDVLGDTFNDLVSAESLIIVEHGTKIVDHDGKVIFGDYFSIEEIEHAVDFIRANIGLFRLVWFSPDQGRIQVCCLDESYVQAETEARQRYADVYATSIGGLREQLLKQRITSIGVKLHGHVKVENLKLAFTRSSISVIFQDGNMEIVKSNTNKGLAVLYAAKYLSIDLADVLLAGNAINDVEMLDLDVGTAILVSGGEDRSTILSYLSSPEKIISVASPEELGKYLSTSTEV